jgi:peptide-methionine (S)-S-oxide reductase
MYKKMNLTFLFLVGLATLTLSCQASNSNEAIENQNLTINDDSAETNGLESQKKDLNSLQRAYFASGCFWCVEAIFEHVKGVEEVYNGYSGGHTKNPTYEASNTGTTGHAEAVEVFYDSTIVSFQELLEVYFGSQNIEQVNGQGNDYGSQYRSIVFYQSDAQLALINAKIASLTAEGYKVASEVKKFEKFWMAEDYHQDYEKLHPNQSYIVNVSIPRLNKFKAGYPHILKDNQH